MQGSTIWCRQTGGGYTKYTNGEETEFYQVAEGVNWLEYENLVNDDNTESEDHLDALPGCQDRSIRVIRNGECISNLGVDVNVTSLGCYDKNKIQPGPKRVVFGTSSGTVAMLRVDQDGAGAHGWAISAKSKVRHWPHTITATLFFSISNSSLSLAPRAGQRHGQRLDLLGHLQGRS